MESLGRNTHTGGGLLPVSLSVGIPTYRRERVATNTEKKARRANFGNVT